MQRDCDVHCAAGVTWHVNEASSTVINVPSGASADKGGGRECVGMGVIWEIPLPSPFCYGPKTAVRHSQIYVF